MAIAYVVGAWIVIEVTATVLPILGAPDWTVRAITILVILAFPVALILSWIFDITPEGIVETPPLESDEEEVITDAIEVPDAPAPFAERRSITVLRYLIDMRDEQGDELDPEALRDMLPALHQRCGEIIRQHGGHLAWDNQSEAEVYFGYPVAIEHDARSAVRCALNLVHEIGADRAKDGVAVDARAGICSGITVTEPAQEAEDGDAVHQVTGKVLRGAAVLLDAATPGSVVISGSTRALIGDRFEFSPVDEASDDADADRSWYVLREHPPIYDATQQPPVAELLGRDSELSLIESIWQRTTQETGQAIAIVGEPGYGKSALVSHVIKKIADQESGVIAVCQCSYLNRDVALHPVADLYRRSLIGLDRAEGAEQSVEMIENFLRERNLDLESNVPLLCDLLHVAPTPKYPPLELEPQEIKVQTLEFIIDSLFQRAAQQPVLLVFEDLHWADATTVELLGRVIRRGPEAQLCTLLTFRPEFDAPWAGKSAVTQVTLQSLSGEQARTLVRTLAVDADLPEDLCERIVKQSDGVPLFLEELTKAVLDSADLSDASTVDHVPATLQETLMARLDRLGVAKQVAQMASVFGREFDYDWIADLSEFDQEVLDDALDTLVSSELLYQRGARPKARYFFKHVLFQEAAYESLLKRDRRQFHQRSASMFENEFQEWRQRHPQVVAAHWAAADEPLKAAALFFEAGNHAVRHSAYHEAEQQLLAALAQVERPESTDEGKKLELEVCVVLGQAMTPTHGFYSKAVEKIYERARHLSVELGEAETNYRITTGLWRAKIAQGRLLEAQKHAEETHDIARLVGSDVSLMGSNTLLGITDFHLGDFASAEQRLGRVIELYGQDPRDGLADVFGQDPAATSLGWFTLSRWLRGFPAESHGAIDRALDLSRRLDHPFTLAYTLRQSLLLQYFSGELDRMSETADELEELAQAQGFAEMALYVTFWRLVMNARQTGAGGNLEGIVQIVEMCKQTGIVLNLPYIRGILAEQYLAEGKHEASTGELNAALQEAGKLNIDWYSAELHRLNGRVLMAGADPRPDDAQRSFEQAIELSERQDNVFFGLRARLDLARMYLETDRKQQAADVLAEISQQGIDPANRQELEQKNALEKQLKV